MKQYLIYTASGFSFDENNEDTNNCQILAFDVEANSEGEAIEIYKRQPVGIFADVRAIETIENSDEDKKYIVFCGSSFCEDDEGSEAENYQILAFDVEANSEGEAIEITKANVSGLYTNDFYAICQA